MTTRSRSRSRSRAPIDLPSYYSNVEHMAHMRSQNSKWTFTLNNYTDEDVDRLRGAGNDRSLTIYLVFSYEVAPTTGTPHLQGHIVFVKSPRFRSVRDIVGQGARLFMSKGSSEENYNYISKACGEDDSKIEEFGEMPSNESKQGERCDLEDVKRAIKVDGVRSMKVLRENFSGVCARNKQFVLDYIADQSRAVPMVKHPLHPFQADLYKVLIKRADKRKVIFNVDLDGNAGKSHFSHYVLSLHRDFTQLIDVDTFRDMAYVLSTDSRIIFIDTPKNHQDDEKMKDVYSFCEKIKDGSVFSSKYQPQVKDLFPCHVVVNMNRIPNLSGMSDDRYCILHIHSRPHPTKPDKQEYYYDQDSKRCLEEYTEDAEEYSILFQEACEQENIIDPVYDVNGLITSLDLNNLQPAAAPPVPPAVEINPQDENRSTSSDSSSEFEFNI